MGNWVNKEWSQIEAFSGDEETPINESLKQKFKALKKRSSLTNSNDSNLSNKSSVMDAESTPNPKLLVAKVISDFFLLV